VYIAKADMALPFTGAVFMICLAGQLNLNEIAETGVAMVTSPKKCQ
jgi:hypothetical protein